MHTLILCGSPRRQGNTAYLVSHLIKHLTGPATVLWPYFDNLGPCVDCRNCWREPRCPIQDDMQTVYAGEYDAIVLASPLYFSDVTGPTVSMLSRLQLFYAAERFRGQQVHTRERRAGLILVGGGDGHTAPAQASARRLFRYLNAREVGCAQSLHTDDVPAWQDASALARVREMAAALCESG